MVNKETKTSLSLLNAYNSTNEKLNKYVSNLSFGYQHHDKPFHLCKCTQVNQKVFWFSNSFGIKVGNITVSDHAGKMFLFK